MPTIRNLLIQPFPGCNSSLQSLRSSIIAAFIVFFIIYFLRPFGFDQVPKPYIFTHALLYAAVTLVTTAFNLLVLPRLFYNWFQESTWTLGKELLSMTWQIITISAANAVLTHFLYGWQLSLNTFFAFLGYTSAVGIFPVVFLVLIKHITLLKKYQEAARSLEPQLVLDSVPKIAETRLITLSGEYQNEELHLPAHDILYISAADNYIQVFYLKDSLLKSTLLRSSLKRAEESFQEFPQFFRCHRTYLVNLQKVKQISGNAQGLKLHLQDCDELIPVSRSLNQELKLQMQQQQTEPLAPKSAVRT